jgi:hypothetical protein
VWTETGELHISQSRFDDNSGVLGAGGLYIVSGSVSIAGVTFSHNDAVNTGALRVLAGSVSVRDSTFVEQAGSIDTFYNKGTADVINTTFSRTTNFRFQGGSIIILNEGQLTLRSSTVVANEAVGVFEGGSDILGQNGATTLLQNSIVMPADASAFDCAGDGYISLGNNIIQNPATCNMVLEPTDLVGDAKLGALTDDGTPGNAHFPPLRGSQAIGGAEAAACTKKDQIGQRRLPNCDIGAVEFKRTTQ